MAMLVPQEADTAFALKASAEPSNDVEVWDDTFGSADGYVDVTDEVMEISDEAVEISEGGDIDMDIDYEEVDSECEELMTYGINGSNDTLPPLEGAFSDVTRGPRLDPPSETNPYYIHTSAGGYNECIKVKGDSCLPNCVGYAWGRAYEMTGKRPKLSRGNGCDWWGYNKKGGYYPYGQTPKVGAIACWSQTTSSKGHVAVIEEVKGNKVTVSESWYGTRYFNKRTMKADASDWYGGHFQGYIYVLDPPTYLDPPKFTMEAIACNAVKLSWKKVPNALDYKIVRRVDGSDDYNEAGHTTGTTFTDKGLKPNTKYYYRVYARYGSVVSPKQTGVSITTLNSPLGSPIFTMENVGNTKIKLTWDSISGAEKYKVVRRLDGSDEYNAAGFTTNTTFTDSGLKPNTKYYYRVYAIKGDIVSNKQPGVGFWTLGDNLDPPVFEIEAISTSEIMLQWDSIKNTEHYKIVRRIDGSDEYNQAGVTKDTIFIDSGLQPNTKYYYRVYAINDNVVSPKQDGISCTTFDNVAEEVPDFELLIGDVATNGEIDISDAVTLINYINGMSMLSDEQLIVADVDNEDGVDIADAVAIINHINGLSPIY